MEDKLYRDLSHIHFEQQLWHNELKMINHESTFFLSMLEKIDSPDLSKAHQDSKIDLTARLHAMQRATSRVSTELDSVEQDIADGVQNDDILNKDQRSDNQYMRKTMTSLEQDYRKLKADFKTFFVKTHD